MQNKLNWIEVIGINDLLSESKAKNKCKVS